MAIIANVRYFFDHEGAFFSRETFYFIATEIDLHTCVIFVNKN
jgi:hypothetical protein